MKKIGVFVLLSLILVNSACRDVPPLIRASMDGDIKNVQILIANKEPVDSRDRNGSGPLSVAIAYRHPELALSLLAHGAMPNARNEYGETPLLLATLAGYQEVVTELVDKGAVIDELNPWSGGTLLMDIAEIGLENGFADDQGMITLIKLAGEDSPPRLVDILLAPGWPSNHLSIIPYLCSKGANINARDEHGSTALLKAAFRGQPRLVKVLIECGADVNAVDNSGSTAMGWAFQSNKVSETVRVLREAGGRAIHYGVEEKVGE